MESIVQTSSTASAAQVVCVLGMHRSGTSLATRVLNLLGVYLGREEHIIEPRPDNPKGFWEHEFITGLNEEILRRLGGNSHELPKFSVGWEYAPNLAELRKRARKLLKDEFSGVALWGWKDPRTCLTLPFWQKLVPSMQYVICLRNPVDVASSLRDRDGFSFQKGVNLWLDHVSSAIAHTAGQRRVFVFYEDIMANWRSQLKILSDFLGMPEKLEREEIQRAVQEFIDEELQHHQTTVVESIDEPDLPFAVKALYAVLRVHRSVAVHATAGQMYRFETSTERVLDVFSRHAVHSQAEADGAVRLIAELRSAIQARETRLTEQDRKITQSEEQVAQASREIAQLRSELQAQEALTAKLDTELIHIQQTIGWKLLQQIRPVRDRIFPEASRRRKVYRKLRRTGEILFEEGSKALLQRTHQKLRAAFHPAAEPLAMGVPVQVPSVLLSSDLQRRWQGIEASGFFDRKWYLADNPDVQKANVDPLEHYLRYGAVEGRTPSPIFNTTIYVAAHNGGVRPRDALLHFLRSERTVAPGAYKTTDILLSLQQRYLVNTEMHPVSDRRSLERRWAVYLQCGSNSVHQQWLSSNSRPWDLIVNHYDDTYVGRMPCDIEFQQVGLLPGTKLTSFHCLSAKWSDVVRRYDYILLLDDDILIDEAGISRLFENAENYSLDLAQAALTADSDCAHLVCRNRYAEGIRYVNAVEIMMPLLSRKVIEVARHVFMQTVSGWGLDMVLGKLVADCLNGKAAVIDTVIAKHTKRIDPKGGAFYRMLHRQDLYPEIELTHLQRLYCTGRAIVELAS